MSSVPAPCIHCGHTYGEHKRHDAPPDVAVYVPCTVCSCPGWSDDDPFADFT
jgi:uncharacterized protein (DUF983 family)